MAYTQYTLDTLTAEISKSLGDPTNIYWAKPEIQSAINEALLCYGAMCSFWCERGEFTTNPLTPLYDVSAAIPSLRSRAITLGQLTREIQYHFLESPSGISGAGDSLQFSITQITDAIRRARNQFVLDTRIPLTLTQGALTWDQATGTWNSYIQTWDQLPVGNIPGSSSSFGHVPIDQSIALIARASWTDLITKITYPIRKDDLFGADAYNPNWNLEPDIPYAYTTVEIKDTEIQLIPPPIRSGQINLIYVGTLPLPTNDLTSLGVPDEYAWAIKYLSMYNLLSTYAPGFDPLRAQYCLERYKAAVESTHDQDSILRVQVGNESIPLDTIYNLDAARPTWMNQYGTPDIAACAYDILGLSRVPSRQLGITLDVVRSAPTLLAGDDFVQLPREDVGYLFDYCRHILSFKLGGAEFLATMSLHDNFISGAAQRNTILADKSKYLSQLFDQSKKEQGLSPAA